MRFIRNLLFASLLCLGCLGCNLKAADIVFRFDDFVLIQDNLQEQVIECFRKNNIPLSIAIIPFNENGKAIFSDDVVAHISTLAKSGKLEICLHGYNHHSYGQSLGELCYYSDDEQFAKLEQGKHLIDSLLDISVTTFIPPFNAYNEGTLKALERLELTSISSGLYPGQPTSSEKLQYYPETICDLKDVISSMKEAIRINHNRDGIIVCMLHAYDIDEGFTVEDLDKFLQSIINLSGVNFYTFKGLIGINNTSNSRRIAANMESNFLTKTLKTKNIIYPTGKALVLRGLNCLLYIMLMTVLFIPSILIKKGHRRICILLWGLLAMITFCVVWMHLFTPLKSMLAVAILPTLVFVVILYNNFPHNSQSQ